MFVIKDNNNKMCFLMFLELMNTKNIKKIYAILII